MSKPYRIQVRRAEEAGKDGRRQWRILTKGGNGEPVQVGETKPRKDHTRQTAQAMIQAIVTKNFVFEVWDDKKKKFRVIPNSIFG